MQKRPQVHDRFTGSITKDFPNGPAKSPYPLEVSEQNMNCALAGYHWGGSSRLTDTGSVT